MPKASPLLRVAVPTPLRRSFVYQPPETLTGPEIDALRPGIRVRIPFGRRQLVGILLELTYEQDVETGRLRPALEVLDREPLIPEHLLRLCQWAAAYYQHPVGEALHSLLPVALRQGKEAQARPWPEADANASDQDAALPLSLNPEQSEAVQVVLGEMDGFCCHLLDGVTGSGKTEVYLQIIAEVLTQGRQALILVPEINLTPQTIHRFRQRFQRPIAVLHSGLTNRQRLDAWLRASDGSAGIIIGTRSAVFTPMQSPGLIIVDEEHDTAFKQQDGFRYSARDLAVMRARHEDINIILGSATPALESLHNAQQGRYRHLRLQERPGAQRQTRYQLLDISGQRLQEGFADELLTRIRHHLDAGNQVLVFINRRGFAPVLQCGDCGWVAECSHCDARLTLHRSPLHLRCHHCERRRPPDRHCPECQSHDLIPIGLGTERSEHLLQNVFPEYRVIRIDRDSTRRKEAMNEHLAVIRKGQPCILVGTQMLAKGHHFPDVTMVAVLDADSGLFSADYRGQEHMAQLLVQVAGRAGRADKPGEVLIQTRHAEHQSLQTLIHDGYHVLAEQLLSERAEADMPPYSQLALLRAEAGSAGAAANFLQNARRQSETLLAQHVNGDTATVELTGPLPAPMEKRAGRYRAQLILRSPRRSALQGLLTALCQHLEADRDSRRVRWSVDVDPLDML